MIAMAEPPKAAPARQAEFDIDFSQELPPWDFFPIWHLAERWHCSPAHIINLIASGQLPVNVDLRNLNTSRSMIRVPRKSVVAFLNARKDLAAIAEANPKPAYRDASKRKPKTA